MKTFNPKVSILIPLYNSEKYISETISSAINQTWQNKEIIIIDDGSKDNSLKVAKKFEDNNVKIYTQKNKGSCYTRNRAFDLSSGDFIQYLDADDLLSTDKIKSQINIINKLNHEKDNIITSCQWGVFYKNIDDTKFYNFSIFQDMFPIEWLIESWVSGKMMQPACWLTPRTIIINAGLWEQKFAPNDDGEFFSRVLLNTKKILYDPDPKVYYRRGVENSLSSNINKTAAKGRLNSYLSYEKNILSVENSKRTKYACYRNYLRFIYENYDVDKDLTDIAKHRAKSLVFRRLSPYGGRRFQKAAKIFGFETTLKIRRMINKFKKINIHI